MIGNFYILDDEIFEIKSMEEWNSVEDLGIDFHKSYEDAEYALISELEQLIEIYQTKIDAIKIKNGR